MDVKSSMNWAPGATGTFSVTILLRKAKSLYVLTIHVMRYSAQCHSDECHFAECQCTIDKGPILKSYNETYSRLFYLIWAFGFSSQCHKRVFLFVGKIS